MFKQILVLLFSVAVTRGVPVEKSSKVENEVVVPIISQDLEIFPDGKYTFSYESGDGSKANQEGGLKQIDKETTAGVAQGSFSYQGDDGKTYTVTYIADENGYQPQGEHLPVPPEIPPAIQRALDYLATAPPQTEEEIK